MIDKFLSQLKKYGKLSKEEENYLRTKSKIRYFTKNEIIVQEGEMTHNIYFVIEGCVRLFYNADGKDKTAFFYREGDFILIFRKIKRKVVTQKNYEAFKGTVLVQINRNVVQNLINFSENFESIVREFKERELFETHELISQFITLSPQKRFKKLLESNCNLFLLVSQQHIASYLGVSPETLSRIKKHYYQKNKVLMPA